MEKYKISKRISEKDLEKALSFLEKKENFIPGAPY